MIDDIRDVINWQPSIGLYMIVEQSYFYEDSPKTPRV